MTEELLKRLDLLAAKLGVAVEHLYDVLTTQGYVEGWMALAFTLLGVTLLTIAIRQFVKNVVLVCDTDKDKYWIMLIVWTVIGFFSLVSLGVNGGSIKYLFNPEYFALQEVLKLVQ